MITNADKLLFRPHALGTIMTGVKKGWSVDKSVTCKKYLLKIFREIQYGRYYTHHNKYTEKGIQQEEDAITLIALKRKLDLEKNTKRFVNEWFTGEPDLIVLPETIDAKCSWSLDSFPHQDTYEHDDAYVYQGLGYNSLTGATVHTISYCLVNATANLVQKEKNSLWFNMGCPDKKSEEFIFGCLEIERNMIFDMAQFRKDNPDYETHYHDYNWRYDIPTAERIEEFTIPFNPTTFAAITDRISECRDFMNSKFFKNNPKIYLP